MKRKQSASAFWILLITQTVSLLGSRMSDFAIGIWVTEKTGNVTPLSLVAVFSFLPGLLFSNIAGVLVDRWDRRRVLVIANAGQVVTTLLLMLSFWSGSFQLWHLYVLTAIQSTFGTLLMPAFSSSIPLLIPDKFRDRANALNQLTGPMAGVVAPALAAMLYALISVSGVILLDMLSFIVAGIAPLVIVIPRPAETEEGRKMKGSVLKELAGGFSFLWSRKILLLIALYASAINFILNGLLVMNTPYILARTNGNQAALGIALTAFNVGGILGGILIGVWGGTRPRVHTIMPGLILCGLALMIYGIARTPVFLAIAMFGIMFPLPIVNAPFMSIIQIKTPPDVQGRVFAVLGQIAMLLSPLGSLIIGPLADRIAEPAVQTPGWSLVAPVVGNQHGAGMGLIALIGGLGLVLLTIQVYALPAFRHMERDLPDYTQTNPEPQSTPVAQPAEAVNEAVTA